MRGIYKFQAILPLALAGAMGLTGCTTVKDGEQWTCCSFDGFGKGAKEERPEPVQEVFYTKLLRDQMREAMGQALPTAVADPAADDEPYVVRSTSGWVPDPAGAPMFGGDWQGLYDHDKPLSRKFTAEDAVSKHCQKICEAHMRFSSPKVGQTKVEVVYITDGNRDAFAHELGASIRKRLTKLKRGFAQPQDQADAFDAYEAQLREQGLETAGIDAWGEAPE